MVCSVSNKVQKCIHKWKLSCSAFTVTCGKGLSILFLVMRCSSSELCFEKTCLKARWHGWRLKLLKFLFVVMWVGLVYGNLWAKVYIASFSFSSGIFKTISWILFAITYLQTSLPVFCLSPILQYTLSFFFANGLWRRH